MRTYFFAIRIKIRLCIIDELEVGFWGQCCNSVDFCRTFSGITDYSVIKSEQYTKSRQLINVDKFHAEASNHIYFVQDSK